MTKNKIKESLKKIIRPMINVAQQKSPKVLKEVTSSPSEISRMHTEPRLLMGKIQKALTSVCSDDSIVVFDPTTGKLLATDCNGGDKFTIVIDKESDGVYKITSIKDGSQSEVKRNQNEESVIDFIKDLKVNKEDESYVGKASATNVIPKKSEKKDKKDEESDSCEEVKDIKKQINHKPEEAKERKDEELVKGTKGMSVPKKVVKQIDADTKEKVKLKADSKNESDDDLTLKIDGTSKLTKQNLKESMKTFLRSALNESVGYTHTFRTNIGVNVNGTKIPNLPVDIGYRIKGIGANDVEVLSITTATDSPSFGIKRGRRIK